MKKLPSFMATGNDAVGLLAKDAFPETLIDDLKHAIKQEALEHGADPAEPLIVRLAHRIAWRAAVYASPKLSVNPAKSNQRALKSMVTALQRFQEARAKLDGHTNLALDDWLRQSGPDVHRPRLLDDAVHFWSEGIGSFAAKYTGAKPANDAANKFFFASVLDWREGTGAWPLQVLEPDEKGGTKPKAELYGLLRKLVLHASANHSASPNKELLDCISGNRFIDAIKAAKKQSNEAGAI
ncbi:MAG: hypothetical protein JNJ73_04635 [Hyphomonadaceae bacterium]|nr:hypothetical protein [Hyphomonadaceae bacterium]